LQNFGIFFIYYIFDYIYTISALKKPWSVP
jgi:hypothetical protein